jgi:hypothetical protein
MTDVISERKTGDGREIRSLVEVEDSGVVVYL